MNKGLVTCGETQLIGKQQSKYRNPGSLIPETILSDTAPLTMNMSENRLVGRQAILRPKGRVIFGKICLEISKMCTFLSLL